jgi:uncharacterized protein
MADTRENIVRMLQPLRGELSRLGVRNLFLFGSRARGDARAESDWDFLVEFDGNPGFSQFMGVKQLLEDELKGRVDLLSRAACPPRLWQAISAELIHAA